MKSSILPHKKCFFGTFEKFLRMRLGKICVFVHNKTNSNNYLRNANVSSLWSKSLGLAGRFPFLGYAY